MKVSLDKSGVPFVITYRKILQKPKIVRHRKFVGTVQLVKNIVYKAIAFVEDVSFETNTEVVDPGKSVSVHWAVQVEDPWDMTGREANLVAFRMLNDMPPCGAHFEIISPPTPERSPSEDQSQEEQPPQQAAAAPTPNEFGGRMVQTSPPIMAGPPQQPRNWNDPTFRRPPDPAYAPRPVQPLVEELTGEGGEARPADGNGNSHSVGETDEIAAHLDGPGGLGEDD